jgi:hypothetical protein
MPKLYSHITGKPIEVSESVFNRAVEFAESDEGFVLLNYSPKPSPWEQTHHGMMRLVQEGDRIEAEESAEEKRLKLIPQPLNAEPGKNWADLVG